MKKYLLPILFLSAIFFVAPSVFAEGSEDCSGIWCGPNKDWYFNSSAGRYECQDRIESDADCEPEHNRFSCSQGCYTYTAPACADRDATLSTTASCCTDGQILKYISGDWTCAPDSDTGATIGTTIESTEITNNTIQEIDLEVTNNPTDNYILSYDSSSGGFTWVQDQTGTPLWTASGSNIYRSSGNVGIGTSSPTAKLHVAGTTALNGTVTVSDVSGTVYPITVEVADGGRAVQVIQMISIITTHWGQLYSLDFRQMPGIPFILMSSLTITEKLPGGRLF